MIKLTRINGKPFVLNIDHIETIEETPDTVITLVNGHKYVVEDSIIEVIEKAKNFKKEIRVYIRDEGKGV